MDKTRALFVRRLREADVFGRFQAYCPETSGGHVIIVHAKTSVFDDDLVRIGSANMNNRSGGFDTEIELALVARTDAHRKAMAAFRNGLVGHYMGRTAEVVEQSVEQNGGLVHAMSVLNRSGRLRPIEPERLTKVEQIIAAFHLGDPTQTADSMRPWRRRYQLDHQIRSLAAGSRSLRLGEVETVSKSITSGR
jgi:phosphatidylserine/phosphatidylglycerophosphate/cardiolipin synthase-like enzyme